MRSRSLARVVMATLGVSVVITLGCGQYPAGPSLSPSPPPTRFSVRSISPTEGSNAAATAAVIAGTGFQSGDTVIVDGSRVDATVLSPTTISLTMPAHAAGNVTVTVINSLSQAAQGVPGGFLYEGPPVISEVVPNMGSTDGGTPIIIKGAFKAGIYSVVTVTVDGIKSRDLDWDYDDIYLSTPAHAAGPVAVTVTDRYGRTASSVFTYASPATFDFNGVWQGLAHAVGPSWEAVVVLTIRDNIAVGASCSVCNLVNCPFTSASNLTLDPPPAVANGEFSFTGSGGVSLTGKINSPTRATGLINTPSCGTRQWEASKK